MLDDIPAEFLPEVESGNWADGVNEDGTLQMIWSRMTVFTIRLGRWTRMWTFKRDDVLLRLWTDSTLVQVAEAAGLSGPHRVQPPRGGGGHAFCAGHLREPDGSRSSVAAWRRRYPQCPQCLVDQGTDTPALRSRTTGCRCLEQIHQRQARPGSPSTPVPVDRRIRSSGSAAGATSCSAQTARASR